MSDMTLETTNVMGSAPGEPDQIEMMDEHALRIELRSALSRLVTLTKQYHEDVQAQTLRGDAHLAASKEFERRLQSAESRLGSGLIAIRSILRNIDVQHVLRPALEDAVADMNFAAVEAVACSRCKIHPPSAGILCEQCIQELAVERQEQVKVEIHDHDLSPGGYWRRITPEGE